MSDSSPPPNTPSSHRPDPCSADGGADCREAAAELYTYLDGVLTDDKRELIAEHLDACGSCFDAFEFHVELKMVIATKCHSELPEGLRQRILAALSTL